MSDCFLGFALKVPCGCFLCMSVIPKKMVDSVHSSQKISCCCTSYAAGVTAFLCVVQVFRSSDVTVVVRCFDPEGHRMCESV